MKYEDIQLAQYLLPYSGLSVSQKQKMFAIRNRMIEISENFPQKEMEEKCICDEKKQCTLI